MRLLACGSRTWASEDERYRVHEELFALRPSLIMHGAAKGADECAAAWASLTDTEALAFRADWHRDGKAAGPIRNARMLRDGKPDRGLAFGALWKAYQPTLRDGGSVGGKVCSLHKSRCIDYCPQCKATPPHKPTGTGDMVRRMLDAGLRVRWVASHDATAMDLTEMPLP